MDSREERSLGDRRWSLRQSPHFNRGTRSRCSPATARVNPTKDWTDFLMSLARTTRSSRTPRQQRTFDPNADGIHGSCLSGTTTGPFFFDPTNVVCSVKDPCGAAQRGGARSYHRWCSMPLFSYGNMGRNVLRGPGINDWDISIMRELQVHREQITAVPIQLLQRFQPCAVLCGPTSNGGAVGGAGQFGEVSTDTSPSTSPYYRGPRIIQFALKILF